MITGTSLPMATVAPFNSNTVLASNQTVEIKPILSSSCPPTSLQVSCLLNAVLVTDPRFSLSYFLRTFLNLHILGEDF